MAKKDQEVAQIWDRLKQPEQPVSEDSLCIHDPSMDLTYAIQETKEKAYAMVNAILASIEENQLTAINTKYSFEGLAEVLKASCGKLGDVVYLGARSASIDFIEGTKDLKLRPF